MNTTNFKFIRSLVGIMIVIFAIHALIEYPFSNTYFSINNLVSYVFNVVLTILFFGLLSYFKRRKSEQLGFIFLYSSLFKLIAFFIFIGPLLKTDQGFSKTAVLSFFVPYAASLSIEVYYLTRLLRD